MEIGAWLSLAERLTGGQEVASSNLVAPTIFEGPPTGDSGGRFCLRLVPPVPPWMVRYHHVPRRQVGCDCAPWWVDHESDFGNILFPVPEIRYLVLLFATK